jgi:hypothetical protein
MGEPPAASVLPSFYKIKCQGSFEQNICFSKNGKLVCLIDNKENTPRDILVKVKDIYIQASLKAHSINTLEILLE